MIEAARFTRETLVDQYGCSRRLANRLGALMGKHIAVSLTVLEEATHLPALEALLLHRDILQAETLPDTLAALQHDEQFSALANSFPLSVTTQDDWTLIVSDEETLAEAGWNEADSTPSALLPTPTHPATPSLPAMPSDAAAGRDSTQTAFQPDDIARLRVNIFASSNTADKVAALRQFAFAHLPDAQKNTVFLQALADPDAALRAASAQALRNMGIAADITDAARLLAEGTDSERLLAAERLRDCAGRSPQAADIAIMAIMGTLRDDTCPAALHECVLSMLEEASSALGKERLCQEDIFRVVLEYVADASEKRMVVLRRLARAMDAVSPGWMASHLHAELGGTRSLSYKTSLLDLLAGLSLDTDTASALVTPAVETLLAIPVDTPACRRIGQLLQTLPDAGLSALAANINTTDISHQRFLLRLFDSAGRTYELSAATREAMAHAGMQLLHDAPKQVRADLLETSVCARNDIPAPLRTEIAEGFLRDFQEYCRWPLADLLEDALVHLGPPAVDRIRTVLQEQRNAPEAALLANALGTIGLHLADDNTPESRKEAEDILRELQKMGFGEYACRNALHRAMGIICSGGQISPPVVQLLQRTLISRIQGAVSDACTIEALGLSCKHPATDESTIRTIAGLAQNHLRHASPDPSLTVTSIDGEDVFAMGDEVDIYAELIPACVETLGHLCQSRATPPELRDELMHFLLERWEKTSSFEIQWGPASVARLTEILGILGAEGTISSDDRLQIAHTLARRASDVPTLTALTDILVVEDYSSELNRLAAALSLRLLKWLEESEGLTIEDKEIYLRILARLCQRGTFELRGGKSDRLLERMLNALFAGLRQGISGCYQHLRTLADSKRLPEIQQEYLEKHLAQFTALSRSRK